MDEEFIKDRDEAFKSMDKDKLINFFEKYDFKIPNDEEEFWQRVHQYICSMFSTRQPFIDIQMYNNSHEWLISHGYRTFEEEEEFKKNLNEAIKSMEKNKFISFYEKYHFDIPDNEEEFWKEIHQLICDIYTSELYEIDINQYNQSHRWLVEHGYKTIQEEKEFIKDRNEAFKSMDKDKLIEYCKKYNITIPDDEETFLAGIHKAVIKLFLLEDSPISCEQYNKSYDWLVEHGYSTNSIE